MMKENFKKNIAKFHQIPFEKYLSICYDTVRNMNTIYEAMYRYTYEESEDDENIEQDYGDIGAYSILKVYLDIVVSNISKLYSGNFENFNIITLSDFMSDKNNIAKYPFNIYIEYDNIKSALVSCSDDDFLEDINSAPFKNNNDAKLDFIKKIYGPIYDCNCNEKDITLNDYILAMITSIIGYCSNYSGCCNAYFEDVNFCQYSTAFALDCYELLYNPLFNYNDNSLVNKCMGITYLTCDRVFRQLNIKNDKNMLISSILTVLYTTKFMYCFGSYHITPKNDDNEYNIPFFYFTRNYYSFDNLKSSILTIDDGKYITSSMNHLISERLIYFANKLYDSIGVSDCFSSKEKKTIKGFISGMVVKFIKDSSIGREKWEKILSKDIEDVEKIYNNFISSKSDSKDTISELELQDNESITSSLNDGKSIIKTNIRSNLPIDSLVSTLGNLVESLSKNLKDRKAKALLDTADDAPYVDSTTILKKCNIATVSDILSSFFSTDKSNYDIDNIVNFLTLYKESDLGYNDFHYYELTKNKLEIEYVNNEHNNKLNFTINDMKNRYVIISVTDQDYLENFDGMVDDLIKMFKYIKYELDISTK